MTRCGTSCSGGAVLERQRSGCSAPPALVPSAARCPAQQAAGAEVPAGVGMTLLRWTRQLVVPYRCSHNLTVDCPNASIRVCRQDRLDPSGRMPCTQMWSSSEMTHAS